MAVPSPLRIRIRVMAHAADGFLRIFRMLWFPAKGIRMDRHSSPIPGNREVFFWDEPIFEGRQDGGQIKNILEGILVAVRKRYPIEDRFRQVLCGILIRLGFDQFAVSAQFLLWFLSILPPGKKRGTGILLLLPGAAPKPVHKIVTGAEGRKGIHAGASNERKQHAILWQDLFHPVSQARFGIGAIEEHCEQEKRTQDLSLVLSRPSGAGVVP